MNDNMYAHLPGYPPADFLLAASEKQVGGNHYKSMAVQPWDFIAANNLGFFEGNCIKYICRWRSKGGIQDLEKAQHYLAKLMELAKADSSVRRSVEIARSENEAHIGQRVTPER